TPRLHRASAMCTLGATATSSCGTTARPCIAGDPGRHMRLGSWCARPSPQPRPMVSPACARRHGRRRRSDVLNRAFQRKSECASRQDLSRPTDWRSGQGEAMRARSIIWGAGIALVAILVGLLADDRLARNNLSVSNGPEQRSDFELAGVRYEIALPQGMRL